MTQGIVRNYIEDANKQKRKAPLTLVSASHLFITVVRGREGIHTPRNHYTEMLNISSLYSQSQNTASPDCALVDCINNGE
jgi:hypothetical protein